MTYYVVDFWGIRKSRFLFGRHWFVLSCLVLPCCSYALLSLSLLLSMLFYSIFSPSFVYLEMPIPWHKNTLQKSTCVRMCECTTWWTLYPQVETGEIEKKIGRERKCATSFCGKERRPIEYCLSGCTNIHTHAQASNQLSNYFRAGVFVVS